MNNLNKNIIPTLIIVIPVILLNILNLYSQEKVIDKKEKLGRYYIHTIGKDTKENIYLNVYEVDFVVYVYLDNGDKFNRKELNNILKSKSLRLRIKIISKKEIYHKSS